MFVLRELVREKELKKTPHIPLTHTQIDKQTHIHTQRAGKKKKKKKRERERERGHLLRQLRVCGRI